jgi:hypothetical protein
MTQKTSNPPTPAPADPAAKSKPKVRGRPFQKGVSGNPSGRPKSTFNAREYAAQFAKEAIDVQVKIMRNKKNAPAARSLASREVLDRGLGKAAQFYEGNLNVVYEVCDRPMTPDEWVAEFSEQPAGKGSAH